MGTWEKLLHERVDAIFYPSLTYNIDEGQGDNHYNCPVVAYYAELIAGNMDDLVQTRFLYPYLNINDPRELTKELYAYLNEHLAPVTRQEVRAGRQGRLCRLTRTGCATSAPRATGLTYAREMGAES